MIHLKNSSNLDRKMAKDILRRSRRLASGMDLILRDCRVSKKYVEFDTTIPQSNLDELVEKFSSIGSLDHAKHVVKEIVEKDSNNNLTYKSGGGITSDSDVYKEYQEMCDKVYIP